MTAVRSLVCRTIAGHAADRLHAPPLSVRKTRMAEKPPKYTAAQSFCPRKSFAKLEARVESTRSMIHPKCSLRTREEVVPARLPQCGVFAALPPGGFRALVSRRLEAAHACQDAHLRCRCPFDRRPVYPCRPGRRHAHDALRLRRGHDGSGEPVGQRPHPGRHQGPTRPASIPSWWAIRRPCSFPATRAWRATFTASTPPTA